MERAAAIRDGTVRQDLFADIVPHSLSFGCGRKWFGFPAAVSLLQQNLDFTFCIFQFRLAGIGKVNALFK